MMRFKSAKILLLLPIYCLSVLITNGQTIFMEPSRNTDPAYAQLDLANRLNQWNIRQMGFQIVGNAVGQRRGKPLTQAEINRIIENAKKLNRYNSATTATHYKYNGQSMIPSMLLKDMALDDVNRMMAISLMQKSLTYYLTTSMQDNFESHDLAWATVYFLDISYLVYHDANRPNKSSTSYTGIKPELSFKIYQTISKSLLEDPAVKKMTDAEKQMATENLAIMAGTVSLLYGSLIDPSSITNLGNGLYGPKTSPQEKEKQITAIKQQAKQNMEKVFGVSADKIKITDNGVAFN